MNRIKKVGAVLVGMALPVLAFADPPLDMTATGTTLAGYVATAAAAALAVFAAIYGVRVILRAFKAVK